MRGFRDNEVFLPTENDVIVISPLGALPAIFHDVFLKRDHDFVIVFHGNFYLGSMASVITRFNCKADNYDVIVISPLGGAFDNFYDGF